MRKLTSLLLTAALILRKDFFFFLVVVVPAQCKPRYVVQVVPGADPAGSAIGIEGKNEERCDLAPLLFYRHQLKTDKYFYFVELCISLKASSLLDPGLL